MLTGHVAKAFGLSLLWLSSVLHSRHVVGFPTSDYYEGSGGIGRRLAYPVAGEPNVVPKFG